MMKVIEGHFNPLRRPDRTIYSCRLTEKVQLDSDEREKKYRGEGKENKTAEAGVVSLSLSFSFTIQFKHARSEALGRKRRKCIEPGDKHIDSNIL